MFKIRFISMLVLLAAVVTGAVAQTTYKVSVKGGTEDATSWQGKAGEGEYQALPLEGVALGKAVSVKYSGWKLVKRVKVVREVAPGKPVAEATAEDKGKVIGIDGKIYDDVEAATYFGTTAVAKIVYIGPTGHDTYTHGLALALTDEGLNWSWEAAIGACSEKNMTTPVTNATWLLASREQWEYMLGANGAGDYIALRTGYNFQRVLYWTSTERDGWNAWYYNFDFGSFDGGSKNQVAFAVRPCLAF